MSKLIKRFVPWAIDRTIVENYPVIGRAEPTGQTNKAGK